ncbi:MAG: radical SAM protein [Bacteriovoracia bacterium]
MSIVLAPSVSVYLKTTETCNLNCAHCFTSGSKGAKVFFSPEKVISFFSRLREAAPGVRSMRYMFHGGEPMLAPLADLYAAHAGLKDIFPETRFAMQTNLVYELTDAKRKFMKDVLFEDGFGTSWDYDIRFGSNASDPAAVAELRQKHSDLWEKNVRTLVSDGHYLTMIVSITKRLVEEREPIDIVNYAHSLGFKHILFERITSDGNAKSNQHIQPTNATQDEWLHRMFNQTIQHRTYEYIGNMLMAELVEGFVNHLHVGNRCRTCEQSLLTINADGSISGCPNTAPVDHWGHIDWDIETSFNAKKRLHAISCEVSERNPICYTCPAFEYCNSDCNKLSWDENGTYCAAPKKIWHQMMNEGDIATYKKLLLAKTTSSAHGV